MLRNIWRVGKLLTLLRLTLFAAALDPAIGNPFNDAILANGSSSTNVIGALTLTMPYNLIFDTTRGAAGSGGTAITGTNSVSLAGLLTSGSASVSNLPTKANTGAASITTSASGTWNGNEIKDSTGTPKRILFGPTSDLGKAFASGDILAIPIGDLILTVA